jgi:hypothetical protein
MKAIKGVFISALCFGVGAFVSLSAQEAEQAQAAANQSEFYVTQLPIEKIWTHNKGYVVQYRKTPMINKLVYLPLSWFVRSEENPGPMKGEVVLMGTGKDWPHLSIYYKAGVFDHVRLYVRKAGSHVTWGSIPPYTDYDKDFENVSDLKIDYR